MVDNIHTKPLFSPISSTDKIKKLKRQRDSTQQRRFEGDLEEKRKKHNEGKERSQTSNRYMTEKLREKGKILREDDDTKKHKAEKKKRRANPDHGALIDILA